MAPESSQIALSNLRFNTGRPKGTLVAEIVGVSITSTVTLHPPDARFTLYGNRLFTHREAITAPGTMKLSLRIRASDGTFSDQAFSLEAVAPGGEPSAVMGARITGVASDALYACWFKPARGNLRMPVNGIGSTPDYTFSVDRRAKGAVTWTTVASGSPTSVVMLSGLKPDTEYEVRITPRNASSGMIGAETVVSGRTAAIGADAPAPFRVENKVVVPLPFAVNGTVDNYGTFGPPDRNASVDAMLRRCTELSFRSDFSQLSLHDRDAGVGVWDQGSAWVINNETQFYPSAKACRESGVYPITQEDGFTRFTLALLNPALAHQRAEVSGLPPGWTREKLTHQSGRLDTSRSFALCNEGRFISIRTIWRFNVDPERVAGFWPCPVWTIPFDHAGSDNYIEYDAGCEMFGSDSSRGRSIAFTVHQAEGNGEVWRTPLYVTALRGDFLNAWHCVDYLIDQDTGSSHVVLDGQYVGALQRLDAMPPGARRPMELICNLATTARYGVPDGGPMSMDLALIEVRRSPDPRPPTVARGAQDEATAFVRAAGGASAARRTLLDDLVTRLKAAGFFLPEHRLTALHLLVGGDDNDTQRWVNLMDPSGPRLTRAGSGDALVLGRTGVKGGGGTFLDSGLSWAGRDPLNSVVGFWADAPAISAFGRERVIGLANPAGPLRIDQRRDGVTYNFGLHASGNAAPAPGTERLVEPSPLGHFCLSLHRQRGQPTPFRYAVGASHHVRGGGINRAIADSLLPIPDEPVRLLPGTASCAAIWYGWNPWNPDRQIRFREALRPMLAALRVPTA